MAGEGGGEVLLGWPQCERRIGGDMAGNLKVRASADPRILTETSLDQCGRSPTENESYS